MSRGRQAPLENDRELLLGWDAEDLMNRPFGFAPVSRRIRRGNPQPLTYSGDSHLLTVAPTGAGKGRGVIIPNLLTYNGPVITIDPKAMTAPQERSMPAVRMTSVCPMAKMPTTIDCCTTSDRFGPVRKRSVCVVK